MVMPSTNMPNQENTVFKFFATFWFPKSIFFDTFRINMATNQ